MPLVEKYSADFPVHVPRRAAPNREVVLVTGTTGGLGASLLAVLVQAPEVTRVYALNRKGSGSVYERQKAVLDERGFDSLTILSSPKVVLLESKADEVNLGLSSEVYEEVCRSLPCMCSRVSLAIAQQLRDSLTLIIHNGKIQLVISPFN